MLFRWNGVNCLFVMARISANVADDIKEIIDEFAQRFVDQGQRLPIGKVLEAIIWDVNAQAGYWEDLEQIIREDDAKERALRREKDRNRKRDPERKTGR